MTQDTFRQLVRDGGCVFETTKRPCGAVVALGSKYCPKHKAQMDAQSDRLAQKTASTRRGR